MRLRLAVIPALALSCSRPQSARDADPPRADSALSQPAATPLTRVREMKPGANVTVAGVVTVGSGVVDAGFALQDGPAAIYVAADSATRVVPGQMVRVTGLLADQHGLLVVTPGQVEVAGRTAAYPPYSIRAKRVGEITESMLLSIRGRVLGPVVDDRPYGWKIMVDDGSGAVQVFVPAHHPFDPALYLPGRRVSAEGMGAQYDSTYEVIATAPVRLTP